MNTQQCQIIEGGKPCTDKAVAGLMEIDEQSQRCIVHVCAAHFQEAQNPHPPVLYLSSKLEGAQHEQSASG